MPVKRSYWLPLAVCLTLPTLAQPSAWAGDDTPDGDLLEFLAMWTDDDGGFVDPVQFEKVSLPAKKTSPKDSSGKPEKAIGKDGKNGEDRG